MDVKKEIGKRIKKERNDGGLSLDQLSRRLNGILSASRFGNYEQGARLPGPQEIRMLAVVFGCLPAYLM